MSMHQTESDYMSVGIVMMMMMMMMTILFGTLYECVEVLVTVAAVTHTLKMMVEV